MSYITQRQQSVTLLCEVSSDLPLTKLLWEKNFSLIEKNNERKFSGGNIQCPSLTIKDAEPTDKGSYVCYATNDIGTTQSSSIDLQCTYEKLTSSCKPYILLRSRYTYHAYDVALKKYLINLVNV